MKTVIEMAREAESKHGNTFKDVPEQATLEFIEAFAELVRAAERETWSAQQQEAEPVAWVHICRKRPELRVLSFKEDEPHLKARGYKAHPLTFPQQAQQEPVAHFGSSYVNANGVHVTTVLGASAIPQDAKLYTTPQPAQQEPVAWIHTMIDDVVIGHRPADIARHPDRWTPLYTAPSPCPTCEALARTVMMDQTSHDTPPAQRKPLTDEQKQQLAENWFAEDWAITKAIGMMFDHELLLGIKGKNT